MKTQEHRFTVDAARALPGPDWLVKHRAEAAERLADTSIPTAASEEWRYSPIADLDIAKYQPVTFQPLSASSAFAASQRDTSTTSQLSCVSLASQCDTSTIFDSSAIDLVLGSNKVAVVIEIINGNVFFSKGAERLASCGVTVSVQSDTSVNANRANSDVYDSEGYSHGSEGYSGTSEGYSSDYFVLLNQAFAAAPIVIDIPRSVVVDGVIAVRSHTASIGHTMSGHPTHTDTTNGHRTNSHATSSHTTHTDTTNNHANNSSYAANFPRLAVRVGSNAEVNVLNIQSSSEASLVVPVVDLDVRSGGRINYLNVQAHHTDAWQIAYHKARVERDAALTSAVVGMGGSYARTRSDTALVGRGASGDLLSAYFGSNDQTLDFRTFQDHAAPDTTSNLLYVGAVSGRARSIYTGLIHVRPEARGTNAMQTNRNLKLGEDVWVESVPNLQIENNEVRCSHASTVAPVDPDQLYYLESRGVPTWEAEKLIVCGFFEEVINTLPIQIAEAFVRDEIANKSQVAIAHKREYKRERETS